MQIVSKQEMIIELSGGALGDVKETAELSIATLRGALRDVRRDRCRCPTDLRSQTETLILWESGRQLVDGQDKLMRFLPDLQVAIILQDSCLALGFQIRLLQRGLFPIGRCHACHSSRLIPAAARTFFNKSTLMPAL